MSGINPFVREDLVRILVEEFGNRKVEIVPWTGEMLDCETIEFAKLYQNATPAQRSAFNALADLVREQQGTHD